jgi:ribose transport system substrate-binding protein
MSTKPVISSIGRWLAPLAAIVVVTLPVAACSSSGGTTSAAVGTSAGGGPTTAPTKECTGYTGPDTQYFGSLTEPQVKAGSKFTVGFLQPNGQQPVLITMQKAAEAEVKKLGGTLIVKDANIDPQLQVSQLNELIAQHVNAILASPLVATGLTQGLKDAAAAKIPVVMLDTPPDLTTPLLDNVATSISQAFDYSVYCMMQVVAQRKPGATFAILGSGPPISNLLYMAERMKFWGGHFGLKFLGQVDSQADSPATDAAAAGVVLSRFPKANIVFTTYDEAAVAAAAAFRAGGRQDVAVADPNDGQNIVDPGLKNGSVLAVYRTPWAEMGTQMAIAAYDTVTGQNLPLPKVINIKSDVLTGSSSS